MAQYNSQMAMDFFFDFDNATLQSFGFADPRTVAAEGPTFRVAQAFYNVSSSEFQQAASAAAESLNVIANLTSDLVVKHFGDFGQNLQLGFEDFAQGVLFDERRNVAAPYGFWPVHSMDSIYQAEASGFNAVAFPPNGYYYWYGAVRGTSVVPNSDQQKWLSFGRDLALAAAIQNVAQPQRIVGPAAFQTRTPPPTPYTNPCNPPIATAELNAFRDRYLSMSFDQLDAAFQSTDSGRLGPRPDGLR